VCRWVAGGAPAPAAWTRGRGWALSTAAIALPYYRTRQPDIASAAARTLEAVRSDEL